MSGGGGRGARRGFDGIDELLGYRIKNRDLLEEALTHASRTSGVGISYQRLEFLGDRVLGIAVAEMLYRRHPRDQEGALTKRYHSHVSGDALAKVAKRIGIAEYVRTQSKMNVERHDPVLGDVMESLIAAIYLDGGLEPARAASSSATPVMGAGTIRLGRERRRGVRARRRPGQEKGCKDGAQRACPWHGP